MEPPRLARGEASKTHRFGVCISGAVALGAYEAGVLAQLYEDIYRFNATCAQQANGARIVIDAIAGSSAGSVTGLALAQAVAFDSTPDQFARAMRACWVQGLDILGLLNPPDSPARALFTPATISALTTDHAVIQYPEQDPDTVIDPSKLLGLWITMTNLDGIPKHVHFRSGQPGGSGISFFAHSYRDYMPFFVQANTIRLASIPYDRLGGVIREAGRQAAPGGSTPVSGALAAWRICDPASWELARDCAIISSSFPFAFRSRQMRRDLSQFRAYEDFYRHVHEALPSRAADLPGPDESVVFQYVDGGVLNNQPIGRLIDAVAHLNLMDPSRVFDQRTYLIIEPDANTPEMVSRALSRPELPPEEDIGLRPGELTGRLVNAYFSDSLYSDFELAAETNRQIHQVNRLFQGLQELARVEGLSAYGQERLARWKYFLDRALRFDRKAEITLDRIPRGIPPRDRLAGDFAGHFGGFFEEELRDHDFQVGKHEARQWFRSWLREKGQEEWRPMVDLDWLGADPPDPNSLDIEGSEATWDTLDERLKDQILAAFAARGDELVSRSVPVSRPFLPLIRSAVVPFTQKSVSPAQIRGALFALYDMAAQSEFGMLAQSALALLAAVIALSLFGGVFLIYWLLRVNTFWPSAGAGFALGALVAAGSAYAGGVFMSRLRKRRQPPAPSQPQEEEA